MNEKKLNRIIAGIVFLISLVVLAMTTQTGIPFWDCGESSAQAFLLQVPHPPGAPFHALIGRVIMMLPFGELAFRFNFMSAVTGSLTVMMTYLCSVILITLWRGTPKNLMDRLIIYGSSIIGALAFSWSDSFWFIAVESTHFSFSLFLLALVTWLALHWYTLEDEPHNEKYFLCILYLQGLAIGVHQLSLLGFFTVALIYYFKRYEFKIKSFAIFIGVTVAAFVFVYKGVMMGIPLLLGTPDLQIVFFILIASMVFGVYYSQKHKMFYINLVILASLLIILGYSTYVSIVIRSNKGLALNENNPNTFERLIPYLNREQYGDWPVVNFDKTKYGGKLFPRRWTNEDYRVARFKDYTSDWDYFVRYQFYNMWFRYLLWNYVGRAGDVQDSPPAFFGKTDPKWVVGTNKALPDKYYAIPFFIGLLGAFYHLMKDKKMGVVIWSLFMVTGIGLMIYQNMQNPQPRERDYFFVGSFFVFAIWISLGVAGIIEMVKTAKENLQDNKIVASGLLGVFFLAVPFNMVYQNFDNHNRHTNYLAWDFSYNLLQSCPKDAILFTAGDNDTFPLWYLQDAEGVRRDIRIVNLSLINTDWYPLQMKNETPYGSKKVPMTMSDEQLDNVVKSFNEWSKSQKVEIPIPKEVYKKFIDEEKSAPADLKSLITYSKMDSVNVSQLPDKMVLNVNSTWQIPDGRGQTHYGLRGQDVIMLDIIKSNNWERPICYYVGVPSSMRVGVDPYLRMEGFIYRITPFGLNTQGEFINTKVTWDNLMKEPEGFAQDPQPGFKFRNLNNTRMYFDENGMRTAQDFRIIFTSLAAHFVNYGDKAKASQILDIMQKKLLDPPVTLDTRSKLNLLYFYSNLERTNEVQKLFDEIEKECLAEIAADPTNYSSRDNPYQNLIGAYELLKKYDKEAGIFKKLLVYFPNDNGIKQRVVQLEAMAKQNVLSNDTTKK